MSTEHREDDTRVAIFAWKYRIVGVIPGSGGTGDVGVGNIEFTAPATGEVRIGDIVRFSAGNQWRCGTVKQRSVELTGADGPAIIRLYVEVAKDIPQGWWWTSA